jgi:hypothetical protein
VVIDQASDILLEAIEAAAPSLMLLNAGPVTIRNSAHLPDGRIEHADRREM